MDGRYETPPQAPLRRSFADGVPWPIERAALAALIDMGMSDPLIAGYFGVDVAEVRALRRRYGLPV